MSFEKLYRDMLQDAQDRIDQLMRDRGLLMSTVRIASCTLEQSGYPITAESIRDTVRKIEERDAEWMQEHDIKDEVTA